jgi:ElaB/YqjD/DUF883 family membrane-anchored ribosome-binding protein
MLEKFENANGGTPSTEFERSIARRAASDGSSSGITTKAPPLVDRNGSALMGDMTKASDDQLKALKAELENLKHSVATIATTARGVAIEKVDVTVADVEESLRRNVFASVGIAALVGYLWGRTR